MDGDLRFMSCSALEKVDTESPINRRSVNSPKGVIEETELPDDDDHFEARKVLFGMRLQLREAKLREPKRHDLDELLNQCEDRICHRDAALNGVLSRSDISLLDSRDSAFLALAGRRLQPMVVEVQA
jgi:hypothetical protein